MTSHIGKWSRSGSGWTVFSRSTLVSTPRSFSTVYCNSGCSAPRTATSTVSSTETWTRGSDGFRSYNSIAVHGRGGTPYPFPAHVSHSCAPARADRCAVRSGNRRSSASNESDPAIPTVRTYYQGGPSCSATCLPLSSSARCSGGRSLCRSHPSPLFHGLQASRRSARGSGRSSRLRNLAWFSYGTPPVLTRAPPPRVVPTARAAESRP